MAKIWFNKGLREFGDHIEKGFIPNWNEYFDKLWIEFAEIKMKCLICGDITTIELDFINFDYDIKEFDINEYVDKFSSLICYTCNALIEIDKWEKVK